jgi:hypothetical protein
MLSSRGFTTAKLRYPLNVVNAARAEGECRLARGAGAAGFRRIWSHYRTQKAPLSLSASLAEAEAERGMSRGRRRSVSKRQMRKQPPRSPHAKVLLCVGGCVRVCARLMPFLCVLAPVVFVASPCARRQQPSLRCRWTNSSDKTLLQVRNARSHKQTQSQPFPRNLAAEAANVRVCLLLARFCFCIFAFRNSQNALLRLELAAPAHGDTPPAHLQFPGVCAAYCCV